MATFGIIGNPVAQSLSPIMHRMFYKATGYDGDYGRFLVAPDDIADVIPAMKALGISGVNVTSPYKQAIFPCLDEISPEAKEIGAVNTVHIREDGSSVGYNTDCHGFAQSLLHAGIEIKGKSFAVCGTGGAGKAARWALMEYGAAKVVMVSGKPENGVSYTELETLPDMDVIVNCTPLGMAPNIGESPVKPEIFAKFKAAADMIYNPAETVFLKDAGRAGLKTLNGLPMLVLQGVRSFGIWTGLDLPEALKTEIIENLSHILKGKYT